MKEKSKVHMIGHLLNLAYLLMLVWLTQMNGIFALEALILLAMLAGFVGLILREAWSGKAFIAAGAFGISYTIARLGAFRSIDEVMPAVAFGLLALTVIAFYSLPVLQKGAFGMGLNPWTLLVIDDDRALLRLLETNFRRYGIFVISAETGERGLAMAEKHNPDLIILDVILPKMKGRAVCAQLKANPATKDIPVIFLTAKNSMADVEAEMEVGAHAHITKPVDFKDLFSQVKKILSPHGH